jgi:hypothetical protein
MWRRRPPDHGFGLKAGLETTLDFDLRFEQAVFFSRSGGVKDFDADLAVFSQLRGNRKGDPSSCLFRM